MAARNAQGGSITFATSAWTGGILEIEPPDLSRESKDTTTLATTTARTNEPAKLVTPGVMRVRFQWDADNPPPYKAVPEIIRVTYPVISGQTTAAKLEFTGWVSKLMPGALSVDNLIEAEMEIQMSGDVTFTDGS